MHHFKTLLLVVLFNHPLFSQEEQVIRVAVGQSETVTVKNLVKAAVGNAKTAKVRAVNQEKLLITGLQIGETSVRAWDAVGEETAIQVAVVNPALTDQKTLGRNGVVKVALQFLEMDGTMGRSVGTRWPDRIAISGHVGVQGTLDNSGINYNAGFSSSQGFIDLMVKEGWARVIANPDLYVRLGENAVFHSGGEFPVTTSAEAYGRYHRQVDWKKFGLTAKVKPESADELHFSSDIHLEISEVNRANSAEDVPGLSRRELDTKMNSIDGETVILSGLVRDSLYEEKVGLPLLGSIPLLGPLLFSTTKTGKETSELLMAVTFSMTTRARENKTYKNFQERFNDRPE